MKKIMLVCLVLAPFLAFAEKAGIPVSLENAMPNEPIVAPLVIPANVPIMKSAVGSDIKITIFVSPGPSSDSPSFAGYQATAMNYIRGFPIPAQNRATSPSAYAPTRVLEYPDLAKASYPLWRGVGSPTGLFVNERGNVTFFGMSLISPSGKINPSQVFFELNSSDGANLLRYTGCIATNTANNQPVGFSQNMMGIDYGPDGIKGTADDISYTSGATVPVNEIYYVGIRTAFAVSDSGVMNAVRDYVLNNEPFRLTCKYYVKSSGITIAENSAIVSSAGQLDIYSGSNRRIMITVLGQPGLTYRVFKTTDNIGKNPVWTQFLNLATGASMDVTSLSTPIIFFKVTR